MPQFGLKEINTIIAGKLLSLADNAYLNPLIQSISTNTLSHKETHSHTRNTHAANTSCHTIYKGERVAVQGSVHATATLSVLGGVSEDEAQEGRGKVM